MSWDIFKQNIKIKTDNPSSISNSKDVAELYANEYDAAVKRGFDTIHKTTIDSGNFDIMVRLFEVAFLLGSVSPIPFDIVGALGKGVQAYWAGARLRPIPIPTIPAPGSTGNLFTLQNIVINPGVFPPQPPIPPTPSSDTILNQFVLASKLHLTSVSGIILTVSTYPPIIAPGVIQWTGYQIP